MAKQVIIQRKLDLTTNKDLRGQTCHFCGRNYQRKVYYNRHIVVCELLSKTVKERRVEQEEGADTPQVRELYEIILELANKVAQMEKKMNDLTKWVDTKKRKIKVIDWLNEKYRAENAPPLDFTTFVGRIHVTRLHLEYLFQHDYITCIGHVLQDMLPQACDRNVLKAFDQKYNVLFGYNASQWVELTEDLFQTMINVITKQLWHEFIVWQKENAPKMVQDEFAVTYAINAKKMMAGNLTAEQIFSRTKIEFYKYLKVPIGVITEVDII